MQLIAVGENVVVEIITEQVTAGGIVIPEVAQNKTSPQLKGKVLSVGKQITDIAEGDIVFFASFGGQAMLINNIIFKVLKYSEIYCIVREITNVKKESE